MASRGSAAGGGATSQAAGKVAHRMLRFPGPGFTTDAGVILVARRTAVNLRGAAAAGAPPDASPGSPAPSGGGKLHPPPRMSHTTEPPLSPSVELPVLLREPA